MSPECLSRISLDPGTPEIESLLPPPFSTNFLYSYLRARHNRLDGGNIRPGIRRAGFASAFEDKGAKRNPKRQQDFPRPLPQEGIAFFEKIVKFYRASTRDKTARRSTVICETFRSGAINNGETSKRRGCWVAGGEKRQREGGNSTVMKSSGTSLTPAAFYPPGDHDHDDV